MVYKHHQIWRDRLGLDSSVWDDNDLAPDLRKKLKNMRRSRPIIPYTLEIECNSYWGNFEREFIGYSMGILDDVQMRINHSEEARAMFWEEVFNKDEPITFEEAIESYELFRDYLLETFQDVDDWEQLTFYQIDWDIMHRNGSNVLKIQLTKPLNYYWKSIIIPRMKAFFTEKPYHYMDKDAALISITLCDRVGNVVKEY